MSIARKLWLGFGILMLLFLLAGIVIVLSAVSVDRNLTQTDEVEEPSRAASYEMEINAVEIGQKVRSYLDDPDPTLRDAVDEDDGQFEEAMGRYEELAETDRDMELGRRLGDEYDDYYALGQGLMDRTDEERDLLIRVNEGFVKADDVIEQDIEDSADPSTTEGAEKVSIATTLDAENAEVRAYQANYLADPRDQYRQRVEENAGNFREALESYRRLDLSPEERTTAEELERIFERNVSDIERVIELNDSLESDLKNFAGLQQGMDDILDDEIQMQAARQVQEAMESVQRALNGVYTTILFMVLLGLLVGVVSAMLVGRTIARSVRRLTEGARRVGEGDLDHRIEPYTDDELGTVAVTFNEMLDKRREANSALRESEERLRGLSEATFEGIVIVDDGKVAEANRTFVEMFGYVDSAEILEKPAVEFVSAGSQNLVHHNISSQSEGTYETVGIKKNGEPFDIEIRGRKSNYRGREVRMTAVRDITERKKSEAKVREAEAKYRTVVEQIPAVTYVQEMDHGLSASFISPQVEAMLGYAPEEYASTPSLWLDTVHPDDRESVLAEDARTDATGEPFRLEYRLCAKDGRVVWVRDEAVVVRDEDGNPLFWQGFMFDITDRKHAEEEVREAEVRYRTLVERLPAVVYTQEVAEPSRTTYMSPQIEALQGYTPKEILSDPEHWTKTLHPDDRERVLAEDARTNEPFVQEYRQFAKDGHVVWVRDEAVVVRDENGKPAFWQGVLSGITERKEAEDALRKSEERYRLVTQATKETIWDSDLAADRQTWNGAFEEMLGYRPDLETDAAWWEDHVHPEDRTRILASIEAVLESGERMWSDEYRFRRADGEHLTVVDRCFVLRDEAGEPERIIGSMMDVTERRRAEEGLRASENELRALFAAMTDVILVLDAEGRYLEIAPTNPSLLFKPSEDLLGKTIHEVFSDAEAEAFLENIRRAIDEQTTILTEYSLQIDGEEVSFSGTISPMREDRIIFVARDVTERKRAEEELKELNESLERRVVERTVQLEEAIEEVRRSEERYGLVISAGNDGIYDFNIAIGEVYWNNRMYEIVGLSREEYTPTFESFFTLLVHPEDAAVMQENFADYLGEADDASYSQEFRIQHSSGEYRRCVTRSEVQRGPDGAALRIAGSVSDITERKRAEEELVKSEKRYRSLFRDNPDAVYSLDLEGNFTSANPANERLSGRRISGLVGMSSIKLVAREHRRGSIESFLAARGGVPQNFEMAIEHIDGHRVEIGMTQLPIFVGGEIVGVYGIAKDITKRKRAEEAIRELNESLENRVVERTEALQNTVAELEKLGAELEDAKVAAEAANKAKSEFLANMSHEIRTPMNGVIGMTELLLDTELSEEQREFAATVRSSGENLLHIINDILDFSKIEAGALRLETINFDLRSEIEEIAHLMAERAHSKGLELFGFVEPSVPTALRGDPFRLRQIMTNLIGNAVKFTAEGEVGVRASLDSEDEEGATVRFDVTDTGIGLDAEQCERLFQSFSQADTSTTRRYGGTGLGLAICKQLAELMDGEIGVDSTPGQGSTFWFTARIKKQSEEARVIVSPRSDLRGLRVLIVDDNATNRSILHKQISSWGMRDDLAEDGPEGLAMLYEAQRAGKPYDLVILDMQMPEMDGMQLAALIKGEPEISITPLVMLTSMGQRGDDAQARAVGISAYLTKPVRQSELYNCLVTVMGSTIETNGARSNSDTVVDLPLITRHNLRAVSRRSRSRLLVAEDNPVNQTVALRMLEKLGYTVNLANNGLEALEALSKTTYDAVLMDCQMPEMDGYEATAEIRRREIATAPNNEPRRIPIIAMTANALTGDREKSLKSGMDDHIAKPVKPTDLAEILERWITQDPTNSGSSVPESEEPEPATEETPLDPDVISGLRELGGDEGPSLVVDLIDIFLDDVPPRLAELQSTVGSNDAAGVERVAHTLKGSAGSMGAVPMSHAADDLQTMGASGDLSRVKDSLNRLESEWRKAKAALEALKASETVAP